MRLADLKLNPDNPRNIKPEKLEKLAQSIKDFPKMMVKRPIVYDEDKIIIGGNMRYKAIEKLGMTEIPDEWTSDASDFTPEERKRFIMQDNAEMGEHDWDMVANQYELEDLEAWGVELPNELKVEAEVEEDEAPEVDESEPPKSKLGEIYQLGRHKVMCADSTVKENVEKLMDGNKADMVFTDPPYNVDYSNADRPKPSKTNLGKIKNDVMGEDDFIYFLSEVYKRIDENTKDDSSFYIWYADKSTIAFYSALQETNIKFNQMLIWKKPMLLGRNRYQYAHEPCIFGIKGSPYFTEDRTKTTVWDFGGYDKSKNVHPTQKPLFLPIEAINNSSRKNDIILDVFGGSGSTLIACEQTDRTCYGMEIDPKYVDVIRKRYWKFVNGDESGWEDNTKAVD